MPGDEIEYLYNKFGDIADGHDSHAVMVAIAAIYADIVRSITSDEAKIRELYDMMANAAIVLSQDGYDQLQTKEDSTQDEEDEAAGSASWYEPRTSKPH